VKIPFGHARANDLGEEIEAICTWPPAIVCDRGESAERAHQAAAANSVLSRSRAVTRDQWVPWLEDFCKIYATPLVCSQESWLALSAILTLCPRHRRKHRHLLCRSIRSCSSSALSSGRSSRPWFMKTFRLPNIRTRKNDPRGNFFRLDESTLVFGAWPAYVTAVQSSCEGELFRVEG